MCNDSTLAELSKKYDVHPKPDNQVEDISDKANDRVISAQERHKEKC